MIKLLFNTKATSVNHLSMDIKDLCVKVTIDKNGKTDVAQTGSDTITELLPYNSYALVVVSGKVKVYRKIEKSDVKFLNLNRLGVSTKLDFANIVQLYGAYDVLQVDTGMLNGNDRDIVIRFFIHAQ